MRRSALYLLGLAVTILVALGLVVLSSASEVRSIRICGKPWYFVTRQLLFIALGIFSAVGVALMDYHRWKDRRWMSIGLAALVFVALCAVFLFPAIKGSHRWIPLPGGISVQPSEVAKLATVVLVSVWLDRIGWKVELLLHGAVYPGLLIGFFALPVILEPDFGSFMVIGLVGLMLMFVAGTRILHLGPITLLAAGLGIWKIMHNANRMARLGPFIAAVASFLGLGGDMDAQMDDPAAYQANQSVIAIRRGGLLGVGIGRSMQKQNYLPEAWTDFIFAVGAEEMGLVFSATVIIVFCAFFGLCIYIARKAPDRFGRLLVIGMSAIVFFQAMFNIGVVCKALPTKGMALPFFSYGGTNMVTSFVAVGFIFSVGLRALKEKDTKRSLGRKAFAN